MRLSPAKLLLIIQCSTVFLSASIMIEGSRVVHSDLVKGGLMIAICPLLLMFLGHRLGREWVFESLRALDDELSPQECERNAAASLLRLSTICVSRTLLKLVGILLAVIVTPALLLPEILQTPDLWQQALTGAIAVILLLTAAQVTHNSLASRLSMK
ncbi:MULTISPECIES: hypothetical protein [unclassified Hahella]|uniref:hypothetical protein n=1 Tax=unclassified Hahella TaxID=2624107 RepID=UPI001C1F03F5|nr:MULTISPECIES: hypothetical protein [unclassified Hahella]MDG9667148.1 hypothetical protein [Hahella sp. CR1]